MNERVFEFGANWRRFLRQLSEERIHAAEESLKVRLNVTRLDGKTFLDVGCGSGLFSLAARRLGARVRSFERLGNDLIVRCQVWLWNLTDAFLGKEPEPSQDVARQSYRYVLEMLDIMEATIGDRAFLAGDTPTIADFTTFAIFQTARERFNQPLGADHPRLDAWYARFRARPSANY